MRFVVGILGWALVCFAPTTCSAQNGANPGNQGPAAWHDPSPHSVQFVTVDKDVNQCAADWSNYEHCDRHPSPPAEAGTPWTLYL